MLHLADADRVIGLHRYCLHTFGGVGQLIDGSNGANVSGGTRSSLSHPRAADRSSGDSSGQDTAMTARLLQHPNSIVGGEADQRQFDWLEGVALQVSGF